MKMLVEVLLVVVGVYLWGMDGYKWRRYFLKYFVRVRRNRLNVYVVL